MTDSYDAVVIGSGFGGGVTACRLAQAGRRVCVLERGRRFAPEDFISEPQQAPTLLWHHLLNPGGIFDLRLFKDIVVLTASGVGGGSLVYSNVQLRAPSEVFEAGWPAEITRAALDPYYDRAEAVLEPRPTPAEPAIPKIRAFREMAAAAGEHATELPIAVYFGEDRENPFGGVPQSGCTNLARCNLGCPRHAKNTIDLNYLARAEREGAVVRACCEVLRLDPPGSPGGRWRVTYRGLDGAAGGDVEAPIVVLAAGALGTTRLLLRNRRRLPAAVRGTRHAVLEQRRRPRGGIRPKPAGDARRADRVRAGDDLTHRLLGAPPVHGRRRLPAAGIHRAPERAARRGRASSAGASTCCCGSGTWRWRSGSATPSSRRRTSSSTSATSRSSIRSCS